MNATPEQVANFLKRKLEQRTTNLREAFRKLDKSNTGFLSSQDFEGTLRDLNIRLTRASLAAVMAKYDVNGDGFVSYQEFCAVMSGQPNAQLRTAPPVKGPGGMTAVEVAEANLRRIMYGAASTLTQAFLRINRDRSGFIEPQELARIFRSANLELSAAELAAIVKHYDTNGDGKVDINELAKALQADVTRYEGHAKRGEKRPRQ